MAGSLGWAPCSGDQVMTICIFSYNNRVSVGFGTDAELIPDADKLGPLFVAEFDAMVAAVEEPQSQSLAVGLTGPHRVHAGSPAQLHDRPGAGRPVDGAMLEVADPPAGHAGALLVAGRQPERRRLSTQRQVLGQDGAMHLIRPRRRRPVDAATRERLVATAAGTGEIHHWPVARAGPPRTPTADTSQDAAVHLPGSGATGRQDDAAREALFPGTGQSGGVLSLGG